MTVLETQRLRLRHFTLDDADFILRLVNDPSWLAFIGDRGVRTLDDARNYLTQGPIAMYAAEGHGLYAVERRDDGALVGMCGLIRRAIWPDPDLGYAMLPEFRGLGYAQEAALACRDLAMQKFRWPRLLATVNAANAGSIRILETLGFRYDRVSEAAHTSAGDVLLYVYEP